MTDGQVVQSTPREKAAMHLANALARLEALEDEKSEWLRDYRKEKQDLLRQVKLLRQEVLTGQGALFDGDED